MPKIKASARFCQGQRIMVHLKKRLHQRKVARVQHCPIGQPRILKPIAAAPLTKISVIGQHRVQRRLGIFGVHERLDGEDRAVELDWKSPTATAREHKTLKQVGLCQRHQIGIVTADL